ncbi:MAG: glycoside hydrolase family 13 protein [Bacteroidota bacterium]
MRTSLHKATGYFVCLLLIAFSASGQRSKESFTHVEPPFWWIGMKNSSVQIVFHNSGLDISGYKANVRYDGVVLKETSTVENKHYLFLTLDISSTAKPGAVPITFIAGKKSFVYNYELKNKSTDKNRIQGFNSSDVVYLIMPDRFANGDSKNDSIAGMLEGAHRHKPESRHGGDLKGITDRIDYLKDLGVTALWLNPVLENNMPRSSYHGYAITDLYQVDRRLGGNEAYLAFINNSHQAGLKVIQDMVMNHIGSNHWLALDPPEKNWIHQFPQFTRSNYQGSVISDPYKSKYDENLMGNGWFDTTMPDVNQENTLFATYLIQNTLWWIEYAGIDGIRMDTQPYPEKNFMSRWAKVVMEEYPQFNIVGEVWINSIATTAYWQKGMVNADGYQSNLPTVTDFPFCFSIPQALNEPGGWDTGMRRLYTLLSQDFIYPNANNNLTFLDNHDMTRFYLSVGKDIKKLKMGLTFLLTTRGIPEIYYGTELLMDGDGGYHPNVRKDFPGGWIGDQNNAFTKEGRSKEQNEIFDFLKTLLGWRKNEPVIHQGKLTHYIPEDNIYVYFRHDNHKTIMVAMNANSADKTLNTARFQENLRNARRGVDVLTQKEIPDLTNLQLPSQTALIIEIK